MAPKRLIFACFAQGFTEFSHPDITLPVRA